MTNRTLIAAAAVIIAGGVSVHTASGARATLIEARGLVYDANYRNDGRSLELAIMTLESLTSDVEVAAYAHYYASFACWALAATQMVAGDPAAALASARRAVIHAKAGLAIRNRDPEFYAAVANALIAVAVLDKPTFEATAAELGPIRRQALQLGPENPRVVLMDAGMIFNNPPAVGGGREKGLGRWREALALFDKEVKATSVDPLAPRWGTALAWGWMAGMLLSMEPPRLDEARAAADTALRMRPDFWYVRNQILPKLR